MNAKKSNIKCIAIVRWCKDVRETFEHVRFSATSASTSTFLFEAKGVKPKDAYTTQSFTHTASAWERQAVRQRELGQVVYYIAVLCQPIFIFVLPMSTVLIFLFYLFRDPHNFCMWPECLHCDFFSYFLATLLQQIAMEIRLVVSENDNSHEKVKELSLNSNFW